jgi:hypothetical protein
MPSELYHQASEALEADQRAALSRCEEWLEGLRVEPSRRRVDGKRILDNLRREAHLNGDAGYGDPQSMTRFLSEWAVAHTAVLEDAERGSCYASCCRGHQRKGTAIPRGVLPGTLKRFVTSRALLARLIERILGDEARRDFERGVLDPQNAMARLQRRWAPEALRDDDQLSAGGVVFATFEHAAGFPRQSPRSLAEALGLNVAHGAGPDAPFLVELTYATDAVTDHRFPTVADALWFDLFEPAPERPPDPGEPQTCYGWTRPLGAQDPQPEVVHANAPLRVLAGPPDWVGRIT